MTLILNTYIINLLEKKKKSFFSNVSLPLDKDNLSLVLTERPDPRTNWKCIYTNMVPSKRNLIPIRERILPERNYKPLFIVFL